MPLIKHRKTEGGLLLLWEISESLEQLVLLGKEFIKDPAYQKITHPKRQKEWLTVRLLQQAANCTQHQFRYNETGQPCIDHPFFRSISISHSSDLVGIFLHRDKTTGLDIESENRNFIRVEKKYLTEEEAYWAKRIPNGYGWFWCIKEAAYKAAGVPGLIFRDQINIYQQKNGSLGVSVQLKLPLYFDIHQEKFHGQLIVYLTVRKNSQN
jgi:phosphopantetheinyl transferase